MLLYLAISFIFIHIFYEMKRVNKLVLLILFVLPFASPAQNITNRLTAWSAQNPVEKLYLHTDRDHYYPGQTLWFKGYFMSEFLPSANSTTVYVELLNNRHEVLLRNIFPVYFSTAIGQMELPDELSPGIYQLRAYSPVMLNQPGFTFNKKITIYGGEDKKVANKGSAGKKQLAFFPEGGNFIAGLENVVAFKSTDANGMPLPVEGEVKNSQGQVIATFKSVHDGMGTFSITPAQGEAYYATTGSSGEKYALPKQTADGIVLNVTNLPGRKRFSILTGGSSNVLKPAYMIGEMQNRVIFKQPLQSDKKEITGTIKTDNFYSGILHLTVFNKDDMPLAERITFIDNQEYALRATLLADTTDTGPRKRNHFTFSIQDTVIGNFSVSVTDADYEDAAARPLNIYSAFLLTSDIRGYVHDPAYYFTDGSDSVKNALELVMMTNGWTRFRWTDVSRSQLPRTLYKDPGYIKLAGKIYIDGSRKTLADKDVIMFTSPPGSSIERRGMPRLFQTDSAGHFEMDSVLFYDKMNLLFSEVRGKKNKFIQVKLDGDSLSRTYPVDLTPMPFYYSGKDTTMASRMILDYQRYVRGKEVVLENVIVKAKQKTPLEKLDEEYSSGLFSGNIYSRKLDLREENYGGNIFQYLQERIPGLKITGDPGNYKLHYRGGDITYYIYGDDSSESNVSLFLNEMPADVVSLETVPVNEIAYVKLIPSSVASAGGGTALVVYTKKGADLRMTVEAPTDIITYQGYTIVKEFYNPDYAKEPVDHKQDNRVTLMWNPDLFISGVNPRAALSFYNNDRTKRFKVVVEGVTTDGRMLMLEKVIEPDK